MVLAEAAPAVDCELGDCGLWALHLQQLLLLDDWTALLQHPAPPVQHSAHLMACHVTGSSNARRHAVELWAYHPQQWFLALRS